MKGLREALSAGLAAVQSGHLEHVNWIPVEFNSFCTNNFCAFRVVAEVAGLSLLVDSGSSTLGFCLPYEAGEVENVVPAQIDGEIAAQCACYGGGDHGWTGPSMVGDVKGPHGGWLHHVVFSNMTYKVGENGNACGQPAINSQGASAPLGGIWGIGSKPINFVGIMTPELYSTWAGVSSKGQCDRSKGECQCFSSGVLAGNTLLQTIGYYNDNNEAKDQWGLSWSGNLGPGSGRMYFGVYADNPLAGQSRASGKIPIDTSQGFYSFNVSGVVMNGVRLDVKPYASIFDTGSPRIYLPDEVYSKLGSASGGLEDISISFILDTPTGPFTLKTSVNKSTRSEFESSNGGPAMFGLAIMRYLEYAKFHFGEGQYMQFVGRDPSTFILTPNLNI